MSTWLMGVPRTHAPPVRFPIGKTMRFRTSEAERRVQREVVAPAEAILEAEPSNTADPFALKVLVAGEHVGYVPRTHNRLVEPGLAKLIDTGENGCNWIIEASPCAELDVGPPVDERVGAASKDELILECALVEVKGPGDSFSGRLGQLLWLRDLRLAGVNARLCYIQEPQTSASSKVTVRMCGATQDPETPCGAHSRGKPSFDRGKAEGCSQFRRWKPPPPLSAQDDDFA